MNLRVIHLTRKVERIDRDLEELDTLLGTLQMDREYSLRLRDSLIEESFRLKQLRQKINSQVIRIPGHFEAFVETTVPAARRHADLRPAANQSKPEPASEPQPGERKAPESRVGPAGATKAATHASPPEIPASETAQTPPVARPDRVPELVPVERTGRRGEKKKPPFLFRFE